MKSVYIELFLLDNFLMNYLILRLTHTVCGIKPGFGTWAAAMTGGIYAAFQASGMAALNLLPLKIALSVVMVCLAFYKKGRKILKPLIVFYAASFIAGGAVIGLNHLTNTGYVSNGAIHHSLPLRSLLVGAAAMLILKRLFKKLRSSWLLKRSEVTLSITVGGKKAVLDALVDTGNSAVEPLSGKPVVIAELGRVKGILHDAFSRAVLNGDMPEEEGVRAVPFRSVSGRGVIPAIKPDEMSIDDGEGPMRLDAYLGICRKLTGRSALINPAAVSTSKEGYSVE